MNQEEIEAKAKQYAISKAGGINELTGILSIGYEDGYKAAKDEGKYSEEDIKEAVKMARVPTTSCFYMPLLDILETINKNNKADH